MRRKTFTNKYFLILILVFTSTNCLNPAIAELKTITPGIYSPTDTLFNWAGYTLQLNVLSGDSLEVQGIKTCIIYEYIGHYRLDSGKVFLFDIRYRDRPSCDSTWLAWVDVPAYAQEIRNISSTWFELLFGADSLPVHKWIRFNKT
jgi:hypothetical protein